MIWPQHRRLQRPGLRAVPAARLPVQPPPGRPRLRPLLAHHPHRRLRPAQRPGPPPDQHRPHRRALGRPAPRRRQPGHRHRPRQRPPARPTRRRPAHPARAGRRRTRPDHQDPLPARLPRRRDLPPAHPHPAQPHRKPTRAGPGRLPRPTRATAPALPRRPRRPARRPRPGRQRHRAVEQPLPERALEQLRRDGHDVRDDDVRRLSPLGHDHINLLGRYQFNGTDLIDGQLRPLRDPAVPDT